MASYNAAAILNPTTNYVNSTLAPFSGHFRITQSPSSAQLLLSLTLSNLTPNTTHAFHIHVYGDTSDPGGLGTGGHFNPKQAPHGCPRNGTVATATTHFGDLGNVRTDAIGAVSHTWLSTDLSLIDAAAVGFVVGRGVVLHALPDDCVTGPAGNAGTRWAQGVIAIQDYVLAGTEVLDSVGEDGIAVFKINGGILRGYVQISKRVGSSEVMLVQFGLSGLEKSSLYRLATYPYGAPVTSLSNTTYSRIQSICLNNTLTEFASDPFGNVSCNMQISNATSLSIRSLFGQSLVIFKDTNIKSCDKSAILAIAPIAVKQANNIRISNSTACPALPLSGNGTININSSISIGGNISGENSIDSGVVVPVFAVITAVALLLCACGYSYFKAWEGYRELRDDSIALKPLSTPFVNETDP